MSALPDIRAAILLNGAVKRAWTPEAMPEHYREVITENPFFVVELPDTGLVATGYMDLTEGSVEAIFTLPDYFGKGFAGLIIETIKEEAMTRYGSFSAKGLVLINAEINRQYWCSPRSFSAAREA